MKKIILAVALSLGLSACTVASPDAGQEAVFVQKPMFFGHGGVVDTPVTTGVSYAAFTTDAIIIDTAPIEIRAPFDDLMTKDGIPMHFDAALVLQVTDSVKLVRDFRGGVANPDEKDPRPVWYKTSIESTFRNFVRQAVRKHGMNEVAIDTTAIEEIDAEVNANLTAYLKKIGFPAKLVRTTVGKANPPDAVKDQRIETAQQEQKAISEEKRAKAEVQRKAAELARADADNAYRSAMGLSPEQFVDLDRNNTIRDACAAGKNCTLIVGGQALFTGTK